MWFRVEDGLGIILLSDSMYQYDIFLCYKSEDYDLARRVYDFLVEKGYCVFFAEAELKGNAEYGKLIDAALDSVKHLILVTSSEQYAESSYVQSEWRTFLEEKRAGRKKGNLLTILKGVNASELPISLRHFQSFEYSEFYRIIDFLPGCRLFESCVDPKLDDDRDPNPKWGILLIAIIVICITIIVICIKIPKSPDIIEDQPIVIPTNFNGPDTNIEQSKIDDGKKYPNKELDKNDILDNLVKEYFANVDKYENASDYAENMYQVLKGVVTIEEIFNAIVNAQASKKYETYNDNFLK